MSETITLTIRICAHRVREQFADMALSMAMSFAEILPAWQRGRPLSGGERLRERRRLTTARRLAETDPRIDIQVVTMAAGVCRVAVRRLGGWGCSCGRDDHPLQRVSPRGAGAAALVRQQQPLAGAGADTPRVLPVADGPREQRSPGGADRSPAVSAGSGESSTGDRGQARAGSPSLHPGKGGPAKAAPGAASPDQPLAGVEGEGPPPSDVAADGPGASLHSGEASSSHSSPAGEARPTPSPSTATPGATPPDLNSPGSDPAAERKHP